MANKGGPKKAAYDSAYEKRPEQVKKREMRNQARAQYEKQNGPLPPAVDVDHKKPLDRGTEGANNAANLRPRTEKANRGWRKGKSGYNP